MTKRRKVVVVGGGITGLSAAYYLQREAQLNNQPTDVVVIEAALRLGGKIQTYRADGYIVERGPESFFDLNNTVRTLAKDLNIEHKLVQNKIGNSYVAVGNQLHAIPSNILFGGKLEIAPFVTSTALSLSGKIRAIGDLFIPKTKAEGDEPIGDFFRRRFGREVVENLVEPLLAGTFAGDIDHLSLESMFPQFYQLEKKFGSILMGMKKTGSGFYAIESTNGRIHYESFENGLETLVEELEKQLAPSKILKGVKVEGIEKQVDGSLQLTCQNHAPIIADAVVMATSFNVAQNIFKTEQLMQHIEPMTSATIGTVSMIFKEGQLERYQDAINFFVSRNSDYAITSCTWSNRKWDNVCPEGYELLRIYIGRVGDESIVELSDVEIEKLVIQDLQHAIGLKDAPLKTIVTRWKKAMPQYVVGHERRLETLSNEFHEMYPNVLLVGSCYDGIGIPDCVMQGKAAAREVLELLAR